VTGISELHARALQVTGRVVSRVAAGRWRAATPCAGWDARALVNHLVSGNLWAAELASGAAIEDAGALASPLPVPPGASAQARFLAMLGRAG